MKLKKSLSLLLMASILITTLFSYPIFADNTPLISFTVSSVSVAEGDGLDLTDIVSVDSSIVSLDWYCGYSYADVNQQGIVTGLKAGTATIILTGFDTYGNEHTAECIVYVYKPDGVYYIKNLNSNYYLHVEGGGITDGTNVYQYSRYTASGYVLDDSDARQLWRTHYLGEGKYSIRPWHKLNMGLNVDDTNNYNVNINDIGTYDTISSVDSSAIWTIDWYGTGYMIMQNGLRSRTMQVANASTSLYANVTTATYANNNNCKWALEAIQNPPEGFYFYDTENETVDSAPIRYVAPQETLPLSHSNSLNLELSVIQLSDSFYEEPVHWTSSDPEIATVVSYNGTVTGVKSGTTTITATLAYSGYSKSYTLVVTEIPNGTYYLKNIETGCFADMTTSSPNNGTAVYQYNYSDFEIYQNDDELVEVNFDRNSITKWELKRISGVYYTICISNLSTPYYLSVINGSTNVDVGIVVYTGTVGRYMQWKIEPVHETIDNVQYIKGYKIIPAHTSFKDYVLATATSSSTNNIQLIQGDYIADNGYYRDVWYVLKEYDMDFYAIDDGNRSRQQLPYEDSITHIVSFGGYDDLEIVTQSNATDCKADLDSSEYMIIHAHGDIAAYANIIKLDKDDATYLFSYDSTNLSGQSKYLGSNSNEDYSNLKLVLFMNCHSGETDFNFVSRIVDLGAKNAIGFIGKQDTDKAEEWQVTFWESYCAGNNIDICIRIACAASGILYSDVVVEGNVSDTIFKQTATT